MNVRIIYQVHKWLAAVGLVASLGWFVSGAVMVAPGHWRTLSPNITIGADAEARRSSAPAFEDARVSVSSAIAAARAQAPRPGRVMSVRLRRFPGRLAYEVILGYDPYLVDALAWTVFTPSPELAEQVVAEALGEEIPLRPVRLKTQRTATTADPCRRIASRWQTGKGRCFM